MDHIQPFVEFCKDVFADFVMRLMKATGGYEVRIPVLGMYGCVWKNGKPSHPKQMRSAQELRMPRWHRLMLDYMAQQRLEQRRAYDQRWNQNKMVYTQKGGKIGRVHTIAASTP